MQKIPLYSRLALAIAFQKAAGCDGNHTMVDRWSNVLDHLLDELPLPVAFLPSDECHDGLILLEYEGFTIRVQPSLSHGFTIFVDGQGGDELLRHSFAAALAKLGDPPCVGV